MALVKNFGTFKRYVRYNFSAEDIGSLPDTAPVEREYILPLIGQTLYTDLQTQVDADVITKPELLDIVRAAAVPLTVYNELPFLQVQLGDSGLRKLLSENTQGAFRWEFNEVRDTLEDKGCKALDQLITYLYANKVALAWTAPANIPVVFKTGTEFTVYYGLKYPHRTFMSLVELVSEVEEQYIGSSIGDAFLVALIAKDAPNDLEKAAIKLIKKAVANLTAMKAIEKKPVRITPHGLFVMIGDSVDDKQPKDKTAAAAQLNMQHDAAERDGKSYLQKLLLHLNTNASAEVFTDFFGSDYYTSPAVKAAKENPNANRKTYGF
jgi:hypothetical protein